MNPISRRMIDRGLRSASAAVRRMALPALFIVAYTLGGSTAYAQYGKITAKITDAKSGEPLLRATVQVLETRQGAFTKDDGVATIINVAPDQNYTVVAKYAGYIPDTVKHVRVRADITTSLSFKLGTKERTVIVTAQAPLVEKTKTVIESQYTQNSFMSIAGRQRIDEIIKLTPGAVQDNAGGGISFHGSRGTSNSIRVNGVEITDPLTGRAGSLQQSISRLAISEVDVVTGSADASKGGFTGGEINTQTKAGGNQLELTAHYRTEIPSLFGTSGNGFKMMPLGDNIYEVGLGGPVFTDDIKFFGTARINTFSHYTIFTDPTFSNEGLGVIDPLGNNLGEIPNTARFRRSATGKLSFNALGFSVSANTELSSETDELGGWGTLYEDPYYIPAEQQVNNVYSLTARGEIGSGVLELTGSYSIYDIQLGKYDHSQPLDVFHSPQFLSVADNYTYNDIDRSVTKQPDGIVDIYTPVSRQIPDPSDPTKPFTTGSPTGINPFTGHIEGGTIIQSSANGYGVAGLFAVAGNNSGFVIRNSGQSQFSGQYSIQLGSHQLNTGFEGNLMSIYKYENDLPWDPNPFKDSFQVHPYTAAIYATDKMEFSDITFAPGLRFDMYQSDAYQINNVYNPIANGVSKAPVQTQLSPRLAITYAVTDQTTFNFGYNWYFKQPNLNDVLTNTAGGDLNALNRALIRGNQIIGNAGLAAERTKEIDVGFNTQLSDVFAFSITGIYKDLRNQSGLESVSSPLLASGYTIYTDDQYGSSRAIELVAEKRMSDNYSAKLQYTYSSAKGTSSSATEAYQNLINQDPGSQQATLPLSPFPFSYDRTHVASLLFNLNYNKGEGPTLFGSKLLQWFSLQTTTEYQSGTPYTKVNLRGAQIGDINGEREPDYFQTDATLTRTVPFEDLFGASMKNIFLDLQLEVINLFNQTNPISVYPVTGQGDNDGTTGQLGAALDYYNDPTNLRGNSIDALGNLYYNPRIDLNHDGRVSVAEQQIAYTRYRTDNFNRRTNYQVPRRVYFNATIRF